MQDLVKVMYPSRVQVAESYGHKAEDINHRAEADAWGCLALWQHHIMPKLTEVEDVTLDRAMRISGVMLNRED
jgi:hypothetical protein